MQKQLGVGGAVTAIGTFMAVWLFPAFVIEGMANLGAPIPGTGHVDIWPATLGLPGLVGGLLFAALLPVAARGRDQAAPPAWLLAGLGAFVGLMLGGIFLAVGWIGGDRTMTEFAFAIGMSVLGGLAVAVALRLRARRSPVGAGLA